MALRDIPRSIEEQNLLVQRFQTASSMAPPEDLLERREVQEEYRLALLKAATILDSQVADSRVKSVALTAIDDALLWGGKAVFS